MPDEHVEVTSHAGASLERPESAEERATQLAELQDQVGCLTDVILNYCYRVLSKKNCATSKKAQPKSN